MLEPRVAGNGVAGNRVAGNRVAGQGSAERMVAVWCPDWPVVAWGIPMDEPVAVVVADRVVATSPAARGEGVRRGQLRRQAQQVAPQVALVERNTEREVRLFEPILESLESVSHIVEVVWPGLAVFPARGPARFFGGDELLAAAIIERVEEVLDGRSQPKVGVADGMFAARLAARVKGDASFCVIEPGASPHFLADFPVAVLEQSELVGVLVQLGVKTLGAFAALPAADVLGRFGLVGQAAHRLARVEHDDRLEGSRSAKPLEAVWNFDPPAQRLQACVVAAGLLGENLCADLFKQGLSCTRVAIEIESSEGEFRRRLWRDSGFSLSAAGLASRVRWQLDAWLNSSVRPKSGVAKLSIVADQVAPASGTQLGLWGGESVRFVAIDKAVARLQSLFGPEAVSVVQRCSGISYGDRVSLLPASAVDVASGDVEGFSLERSGRFLRDRPGQLPNPAPAVVHDDAIAVQLCDSAGGVVGVDARGELSADPNVLGLAGTWRQVVGWSAVWLADERWWDGLTSRRRARLQVQLDDGEACLLAIEGGEWAVEATFS